MPNLPNLPNLKNIPKKQIVIAAMGLVLLVTLTILIIANLRPKEGGGETAKLTAWGILEESVFSELVGSYAAVQPGVELTYRKIDKNNYERVLINALAAGEGPDIYMIRNRWLPKETARIIPAPFELFNVAKMQEFFPAVVEQDFTDGGGQAYALPLYLDTMVTLYNRELFDQASVVAPPANWTEFRNLIPKLRVLSETGQVIRAAAAVGGSEKSVENATDILNLLMMQNGVSMVNAERTEADFGARGGSESGLTAFNFYLQFANAGSPYYTWNDNQESSLDSFVAGQTAMVFKYRSQIQEIKSRAPFLNFGVAPMLQLEGSERHTNYADYWGLAVSKRTQSPLQAWNFVVYTTTNPDIMRKYSQTTGSPPALRALVNENLADVNLGIFAKQALTARSWYQADESAIREIFSRTISRVLTGQASPERALGEAQEQITELMGGNR